MKVSIHPTYGCDPCQVESRSVPQWQQKPDGQQWKDREQRDVQLLPCGSAPRRQVIRVDETCRGEEHSRQGNQGNSSPPHFTSIGGSSALGHFVSFGSLTSVVMLPDKRWAPLYSIVAELRPRPAWNGMERQRCVSEAPQRARPLECRASAAMRGSRAMNRHQPALGGRSIDADGSSVSWQI
jgi:hypothetical protein